MNTNLMAVLSLAVILALVAVLLYFVGAVTRRLEHTGTILRSGKVIAGNIRKDCESIIQGVVALNNNLGVAAGGLGAAAQAANAAAGRAANAKAAAAAQAAAAQAAAAQAAAAPAAPVAPAAGGWTPPAPVVPSDDAAVVMASAPEEPAAEPTGFVWPYPPPARA